MRIVHAASELFPFVKTGGLADAAGSLTRSLAEMGNEVAVFLPGYRTVLDDSKVREGRHLQPLAVEMGGRVYHGEVLEVQLAERLKLYLICRDEFFDRTHPYG